MFLGVVESLESTLTGLFRTVLEGRKGSIASDCRQVQVLGLARFPCPTERWRDRLI